MGSLRSLKQKDKHGRIEVLQVSCVNYSYLYCFDWKSVPAGETSRARCNINGINGEVVEHRFYERFSEVPRHLDSAWFFVWIINKGPAGGDWVKQGSLDAVIRRWVHLED